MLYYNIFIYFYNADSFPPQLLQIVYVKYVTTYVLVVLDS